MISAHSAVNAVSVSLFQSVLTAIDEAKILWIPAGIRPHRLRDAIDQAYAAKYVTPASRTYVKSFAQRRRRETTLELLPR
jgi:hypothetical protein